MKHEEIKALLAVYLEGETSGDEKKIVEDHLAICQECRNEFGELSQLEEVLNKMKLKEPGKEVWDVYWASVYNRLERKTGWIVFSLGFILLLSFGVYHAIADFLQQPDMPLILKAGIVFLAAGGIILFISILKEQFFFKKKERYKEIRK